MKEIEYIYHDKQENKSYYIKLELFDGDVLIKELKEIILEDWIN